MPQPRAITTKPTITHNISTSERIGPFTLSGVARRRFSPVFPGGVDIEAVRAALGAGGLARAAVCRGRP